MYLLNVNTSHQTPTTLVCAEWLHGRILASLKPLVQATFAGRTDSRMTFVEHQSVDAVRVWPTRSVDVGLAMTARQLTYHHSRNIDVTDRNVTLQRCKLTLLHLSPYAT